MTAFRPLFLAFCAAIAASAFGQGKFTVNGRLKIEGGDLSGARAVVYKNGEKERTITTNLNKFSLDLDLDASYLISFEKDGFVSKKISYNTKVPEGAATNFTPFDFAVSLFKQYDDVNIVVFNQPVGVIRYERSIGDFDYDTDYTKSIQSQLQKALAEVAQKQKEEAEAASQEGKKQASEAKAREKAEAEERKRIETEAKAEKAREEAARKEEEKRQAEARKAEEESRRQEAKLAEEAKKVATPPPAAAPVKPPPAPVAKQEVPKPAPVAKREVERSAPAPRPTAVRRATATPKAVEGEDERRSVEAMQTEEESRMAMARLAAADEERPVEEQVLSETVRNEDLLVEPNKVTTVIRLESSGTTTEYRRVLHKWGGVFFFKNGGPCTGQIYATEALADDRRLAGITPGAKTR